MSGLAEDTTRRTVVLEVGGLHWATQKGCCEGGRRPGVVEVEITDLAVEAMPEIESLGVDCGRQRQSEHSFAQAVAATPTRPAPSAGAFTGSAL